MKIQVTKNTALTQLFYCAAMLSLLTGIIGFAILYGTAISEGIPVFLVGTIAHLGTVFSTVDGAGTMPISSLIIAFLVQYRKTMLFIGLILTAIQAWLKYDAGVPLSFLNILAFPTGTAGTTTRRTPVTPDKTVKTDKSVKVERTDTSASSVTDEKSKTEVTLEKTTEPVKLTIRMRSSDASSEATDTASGSAAAPGKGMKRMGDL